MTLSSSKETVFLAATVLKVLRVNHHHNSRPDIDDSNRVRTNLRLLAFECRIYLKIKEN